LAHNPLRRLEAGVGYNPPRAATKTPRATRSTIAATSACIRNVLLALRRASSRRVHELMNRLRFPVATGL
jgi:hypothetical protein